MSGIADLRHANEVLAEVDPATLSDEELGEALVALARERSRLAATEARLTAAFDAWKAYAGDGSKTAAGWLARRAHTPLGACRKQVRLARRLRHMPHTEAALAAGDIDEHRARLLASLAGSHRKLVADAFSEAEEDLVGFAKSLRFDDFVRAVRYWEDVVDEDGDEDQARSDHEARKVHLSQTFRGNWVLDGQFDAIAGTELATALRRIERELFEHDWAEAKAIHGDNTRHEHLARTAAQRRADAMAEMARRAMAAPPGSRLPEPLVVVLVGYETFAGRVCELANGTVVTPGQVARLITHADIERAVFDGPNRVIELGVRSRVFTGGLRRVIEIRDRRCTHPSGCDVPYHECQVDHVQPYSEGGLTVAENGRLLCGRHNRGRNRTRSAPKRRPVVPSVRSSTARRRAHRADGAQIATEWRKHSFGGSQSGLAL